LKHKIQQLEEVTNSSYVHLHSVREKQLLNWLCNETNSQIQSQAQISVQTPTNSSSKTHPTSIPNCEDEIEREKRLAKETLNNTSFFNKFQSTKTISDDIEVGIKVLKILLHIFFNLFLSHLLLLLLTMWCWSV
jgi:hypothetical protein